MDSQDLKTHIATSAGHEGHGAHYLCHRCGWPFPNPHPSAKHRRAHKKVCGTIEGYKIVQSEDDDSAHLTVAVGEHASDDDDEHTPSPKLEGKSSELNGSSEAELKSYKSEDDVFSDAVAGFSDSGVSQRSEESSEGVTGIEKQSDHDGMDDTSIISAVDETAGRKEQINNPTKNSETEHVVYLTDNDDTVNAATLIGLRDSVKHDSVKDDTLASETAKYGDTTITAEVKKEPSGNLELDVTPQTETSEKTVNSATKKSCTDSAELTGSIETSDEKALVKEAHECVEVSVDSTSIKNSDVESTVPSLDKEVTMDPVLPVTSELPNSNNETSDVVLESTNSDRVVNESEKNSHVVTSDETVGHPTPPLNLQDSHETCLTAEGKVTDNGKENLEVTVGETKSQASDTLKSNDDDQKAKDVEAHQPEKSEVFDPSSLKTKDQSGEEVIIETCSSEINLLQNNQQPQSNTLQPDQVPSITKVVNESEDRKENEEIITKVIAHHPLQTLLDEEKPSNKIQDQKKEGDVKDDVAGSTTVKSILDQEAPKYQEHNKDESDSPARYLIENKKEIKKKKSFWVPFMCCSSVHRDL